MRQKLPRTLYAMAEIIASLAIGCAFGHILAHAALAALAQ